MLRPFIDAMATAVAGQCAVCHGWPSRPVCDACVARFAQPQHRCRRCALPMPDGIDTCGRCLAKPQALDACHAAVSYGYPWSALIARFKFQGHAGWARNFALLMRSAPWVEPALEQADLIVPMPLSRERLAERGFNQALVLARALAPARVDAGMLLKVRHTTAQMALQLKDRLANVKGAFAVEPLRAGILRHKRVVLIDDVMTSGASLFTAAAVLRQAGAAHITGLVIARTDDPSVSCRT